MCGVNVMAESTEVYLWSGNVLWGSVAFMGDELR